MGIYTEYQAVRDLMTDIEAIYVARWRAARVAVDTAGVERWLQADLDLRAEVRAIDPWDEVAVPAMRTKLRRRYFELNHVV